MKYLTLLLIFIASIAYAEPKPVGVQYSYEILRVIDGDTVEIKADFLPEPLPKKLSVRVWGVDTPEKSFRAACDLEKTKGEAASEYTKSLLTSAKDVKVELYKWDKYGGRVLGDVIIDGKSLRDMLIANNFASEYYGDTKKSWCN